MAVEVEMDNLPQDLVVLTLVSMVVSTKAPLVQAVAVAVVYKGSLSRVGVAAEM